MPQVARSEGKLATTLTGRKRSPRMIEKSMKTRTAIIRSAARVIEKYGYVGCSVARVASRAKIAHGTFYLYFASQQDLFDAILPFFTEDILNEIGKASRNAKNIIEAEDLGIRANFAYLRTNSYLYRIISEAEAYSLAAFDYYLGRLNEKYSEGLHRFVPDAEGEGVSRKCHIAATMLEGARVRLLRQFALENGKIGELPEDVIQAYLDFVGAGLTSLFSLDRNAPLAAG